MNRSAELFKEANKYIPGGVNSPVRSFKAVGGQPLFIAKGKGNRIWDVDNNEYLDYVGSWGPLIMGHAHPYVLEKLEEAFSLGTSFGAPTEVEVLLAKKIVNAIPSIEKVRMVNSGTEATMSALRLARGYTQRDKVVKFEGCYHGHVDSFLVKAGSGAITLGVPDSPGVTEGTSKDTILLPYNDSLAIRELFEEQGETIAAVIVEPVAGNMGLVLPKEGFLETLRDVTSAYGALLIFDEVITGFRLGLGGAQKYYGVSPDLTCLGKIIGGGLPVGAYGGKKEIMDQIAPSGPVYQAGTLSGNPLAMTAGLAMMELLEREQVNGGYKRLASLTQKLVDGFNNNLDNLGLNYTINSVGSMFTMFFTDGAVESFEDAMRGNVALFEKYFQGMLKEGIYLAPSAFETGFVSFLHGEEDIQYTIEAHYRVLTEIHA